MRVRSPLFLRTWTALRARRQRRGRAGVEDLSANAAAERQVAAFRALHDVTRAAHASLDLQHTLDAVARGVTLASGFSVAAVNMVQPDGNYRVVAVEGTPEVKAELLGVVETAEQWRALLRGSRDWGPLRFLHHDDALSVGDSVYSWIPAIDVPTDPTMWHPLDSLFAPLTGPDGTLLGALSVDLPVSGRLPDEHQQEMLALFADHAAIAIEHARSHAALQSSQEQLRHAATHDPLTGLQNRSVLTEQAPALARQSDGEIAVLVIDLDGFKQVNDTVGHQAGDELLRVLAQRMRGCIRPGDLLARTGGDEFVVVLAAPRLDQRVQHLVRDLAETLRQPTRDQSGVDLQVGATIGVSVSRTPADFDELLLAADRDMYRNKKNRDTDTGREEPLTRSA